jgi:hypothetical protein
LDVRNLFKFATTTTVVAATFSSAAVISCREVAHGPAYLLKAVSIIRDQKKKQDNNPEEITEIVCSSSAIATSSCPLG